MLEKLYFYFGTEKKLLFNYQSPDIKICYGNVIIEDIIREGDRMCIEFNNDNCINFTLSDYEVSNITNGVEFNGVSSKIIFYEEDKL